MTGSPSDTAAPVGPAPVERVVVGARPPRIGPDSRQCPTCGWLMPQPPHKQECSRCARRPDLFQSAPPAPVPLSTTEKLFLAAYLLRDVLVGEAVHEGRVHDAAWDRVMLSAFVERRAPGGAVIRAEGELPAVPALDPLAAPTLPLGTAGPLVRKYLALCAAAWRARGCPL